MNNAKYYITKGNSMRGMLNELKSLRTDIQESMKSAYPMPYETILHRLNEIIKSIGDKESELVKKLVQFRTSLVKSMASTCPMPYSTVIDMLYDIINIVEYGIVFCEVYYDIQPDRDADVASEDTHTNDPVHHPKHYELMPGVEVKDILHALGNKPSELTGWQEFCRGNVLKYMLRAEDKNGMEDYEKAAVYLGWLLEDYGEDR